MPLGQGRLWRRLGIRLTGLHDLFSVSSFLREERESHLRNSDERVRDGRGNLAQ